MFNWIEIVLTIVSMSAVITIVGTVLRIRQLQQITDLQAQICTLQKQCSELQSKVDILAEEKATLYAENRYKTGLAEGQNVSALEIHRAQKKETEAKIEAAHQNGREQGRQELLRQFSVKPSPYTKERKGFFSNKFETGYQLQYFFMGFPIGEPKIVLEEVVEKIDDKRIESFFEKARTIAADISTGFITKILEINARQNQLEDKSGSSLANLRSDDDTPRLG